MEKIKEWLDVRLTIFLENNGNLSKDLILLDVLLQRLSVKVKFTSSVVMMEKIDSTQFKFTVLKQTNGQF